MSSVREVAMAMANPTDDIGMYNCAAAEREQARHTNVGANCLCVMYID